MTVMMDPSAVEESVKKEVEDMKNILDFNHYYYLSDEYEKNLKKPDNEKDYLYLFRLSLKIKYILEILNKMAKDNLILKFKLKVLIRLIFTDV